MKVTTTLATCSLGDGTQLVLQKHDGHFYLKVDGVPLMNTNANVSEQLMAELACERLPAKPRLLIGGLGFGFTLKRTLELCPPEATVVVAELLPEMIEWNREHLREINGHLLDDPRVKLRIGDVNDVIDHAAEERFDAIMLDVDNSPDALVQHANARLYQRQGLQRAKAALQARGRVVYWSAHEDRRFAKLLDKVFAKVACVPAKAYPKAKRFSHTLFVADR